MRRHSYYLSHRSIGGDKEQGNCVYKLDVTSKSRKEQEITLNVLSTWRAGLRAALRIVKPKAPVTNSNKAWSGYTCKHKHTYINCLLPYPLVMSMGSSVHVQIITHVPPERIVGSVRLTRAHWVLNSQHPLLPEVQTWKTENAEWEQLPLKK